MKTATHEQIESRRGSRIGNWNHETFECTMLSNARHPRGKWPRSEKLIIVGWFPSQTLTPSEIWQACHSAWPFLLEFGCSSNPYFSEATSFLATIAPTVLGTPSQANMSLTIFQETNEQHTQPIGMRIKSNKPYSRARTSSINWYQVYIYNIKDKL